MRENGDVIFKLLLNLDTDLCLYCDLFWSSMGSLKVNKMLSEKGKQWLVVKLLYVTVFIKSLWEMLAVCTT